jgi:hypothetical protein
VGVIEGDIKISIGKINMVNNNKDNLEEYFREINDTFLFMNKESNNNIETLDRVIVKGNIFIRIKNWLKYWYNYIFKGYREFDIKCLKLRRLKKMKKVGYNEKDGWYVTAIISEKEITELLNNNKMDSCHKCKKHLHMGFKGTSIGNVLYLVCVFCGWEKDITDYDEW